MGGIDNGGAMPCDLRRNASIMLMVIDHLEYILGTLREANETPRMMCDLARCAAASKGRTYEGQPRQVRERLASPPLPALPCASDAG